MTRFGLALVLVACGGKAGDGGAAAAEGVTAAEVAADNAAIPAEWRGKLAFVAGTIVNDFGGKQTFDLAIPKGWKKGFLGGTLEPADSDGFGSKVFGKSELKVGSGCNGACEPKDWAVAVDEAVYKQYTSGKVHGKLLADDKRPDGRTLMFEVQPEITKQGDTTMSSGMHELHLITTWWKDGDSKYYECRVTLGEPSIGLAKAFEKVCAKVLPR